MFMLFGFSIFQKTKQGHCAAAPASKVPSSGPHPVPHPGGTRGPSARLASEEKRVPAKPRPRSRPRSLFPSRRLTSACTAVASPVQALGAHVTYSRHSPHTVTSSLPSVVLSADPTAGCSREQLMDTFFFFFFSFLPKVYFLWLELQAFCLGSECPASSTLTRGVSRET